MFLTIKPGKPEKIRMQLQRLHSFLHTLDLEGDAIGLLLGIAFIEYLNPKNEPVSPFTVQEYLKNKSAPEYFGAEVILHRKENEQGFVLIKLLCALKKAQGKSKFPEYMAEAQAFAERMQLGKMPGNQEEKTETDDFMDRLKGQIASEVESIKSKMLFHLDQKPRTSELGTYPGTNILLMEELENQFALAAVNYYRQFSKDWENHSFNPTYFDTYIPEVLFPEYREYCQNTLGPLNDYVRSKIFENSMIQFGRTKPAERRARIFSQYVKYYWEPNAPLPPGDMELGYLYQILQSYVRHFHLFKDLVNDLAVNFSIRNNTAHPVSSKPKVQVTKPKFQSFQYKEHSKNPEAINELCKDLKDIGLIDSQTSMREFKRVFLNGQPENPIKWTGTISELHFFIKCLHNQEQKVVDLKQKHWEVAKNCFVDSLGNQFEREKLKNQKDPVSAESIRRLIRNL